MKATIALALAALLGVAASGCDSKKVSGTTTTGSVASALKGSCNNGGRGFCVEFTGGQYTTDQVQTVCRGQNAPYLTGACPTTNVLGTCLVQGGAPLESTYRYYSNIPGGKQAAETQCKMLFGVWTPG